MRVLYVNNDGGGFADYVEIEPNTTVKAFFKQKCQGDPGSYLDPRQSATGAVRLRSATRRPNYHHPDQNRRSCLIV